MKLKDIRNGSLYFNTKKNRVERVISNQFSKTRVVTEFHGKQQSAVGTRYLRLADTKQVENYLTKPPKRGIMSFLFGKLGRA